MTSVSVRGVVDADWGGAARKGGVMVGGVLVLLLPGVVGDSR